MKTILLKTIAQGEIYLGDHQLEINDKSGRMNKHIFHAFPVILIIIAVYHLNTSWLSGNDLLYIVNFVMALGLLLISFHLYYPGFKRTNKKQLNISEIKNVCLKKLFGELYIDFELVDHSSRRVYNLKNMEDWNSIKEYLINNNISYAE